MIYALGDLAPSIHPSAFVAPTASVIGDVSLAANVSVWFGVLLRGDAGNITIGEGCNIQDNAVLHEETTLGKGCTVAHLVLAHALVAEDNVLIGNGAIVFGGVHIGEGAVIGAGAVVSPGTQVPAGTLMLGVPAKPMREVTEELRQLILGTASNYSENRDRYIRELRSLDQHYKGA